MTISVLQLLRFIALLIVSVDSISRSVTLTPTENNKKGVQVYINNPDVISTANGNWNINASSNTGWHLHIAMDHSWNYISDKSYMITFKLYGNSDSSIKDIIFAFSSNNNKYITSNIQLNSYTSQNGIYPQCNSSNNAQPVSMAEGDINLLFNDNNDTNSREYKLTHGTKYKSIPSDDTTTIANDFPLIIQLVNNPINKWFKYKYLNQQCLFEPLETNYPIDIYISAANIGQIVHIHKLQILFTQNVTDYNANDGNSSNWIDNHIRIITILLIIVTIILFMICNMLIVLIIKQNIENSRAQSVATAHMMDNDLDFVDREGSVASEMIDYNDSLHIEL